MRKAAYSHDEMGVWLDVDGWRIFFFFKENKQVNYTLKRFETTSNTEKCLGIHDSQNLRFYNFISETPCFFQK